MCAFAPGLSQSTLMPLSVAQNPSLEDNRCLLPLPLHALVLMASTPADSRLSVGFEGLKFLPPDTSSASLDTSLNSAFNQRQQHTVNLATYSTGLDPLLVLLTLHEHGVFQETRLEALFQTQRDQEVVGLMQQ